MTDTMDQEYFENLYKSVLDRAIGPDHERKTTLHKDFCNYMKLAVWCDLRENIEKYQDMASLAQRMLQPGRDVPFSRSNMAKAVELIREANRLEEKHKIAALNYVIENFDDLMYEAEDRYMCLRFLRDADVQLVEKVRSWRAAQVDNSAVKWWFHPRAT